MQCSSAPLYAWFNDTASTAVNKIQSGNLKVGFQY
ncbi:MAG: SipW-dependent-type signal peptide-containing protein [Oscillospiraceae bacterium]